MVGIIHENFRIILLVMSDDDIYVTLVARQCSARGGDLRITLESSSRVSIAGHATIVLQGTFTFKG